MDSNHVTNVIPLRAEEDRDLESPTHTPPTAYIWCQRGGIKMDNIYPKIPVYIQTLGRISEREPQTHGQYGLPN